MRSSILVVGLVAACTAPNPGFAVRDSLSSQTATDEGSGEPTITQSTTANIASDITLDPSASTASTAATGTTGTTGTTGEPVDCWAQGAAGWPSDGEQLDFQGSPNFPVLSPDGLQLHYLALIPSRLFRSTRAQPDGIFPEGEQLTFWKNEAGLDPYSLMVMLGGAELLLVNNQDVYAAKATPDNIDKVAVPLVLDPPSTVKDERMITATADGAIVLVSRHDGPPIGEVSPDGSDRLYQYTRAEPGTPYAGGEEVSPVVLPLGVFACPALSPDGLHLFFTSTESDTLTLENFEAVAGIFYTSRTDPSAKWAVPQRLAIENAGQGFSCPGSVTADGCQLLFRRTFLGQSGATIHLATRAL